jgi:hypothetical protein
MSDAGWQALAEAIATARAEVAAVAPDEPTAAEGEAYVARVLSAQLATALLGHLFVEEGLGRALPVQGGPNPDYLMRHAGVAMDSRLRLSGELNASERVGVGLYRFDQTGAIFEEAYRAFDAGNTGRDGRFALDISADGEMAITPEARTMLIRILHRAPGEPAARVGVENAGAPGALTLMGGSIDTALAIAARGLTTNVRQFLEWTRVTSALPNRIAAPPEHLAAAVKADPDTDYYLGYYQLGEGEWLEALMPEGIGGYWSVHAYNHWTENLQTQGAHDRNARPDADGRIRLRIGPEVPAGLANRIDTAGRRRGMLVCRIIGSPVAAPPETQLRRAT